MKTVTRSETSQPTRLRVRLYRLKRHLSKRVSRSVRDIALALLEKYFLGRPIPIKHLQSLCRGLSIVNGKHPLARRATDVITTGTALKNPALAEKLGSTELGNSSLPAETLNYLEDYIMRHRPGMILEFGSGISTVCLSQYMHELHGEENPPYIISFEQDQKYADATREMLAQHDLAQYAKVVHVPLATRQLNGVETLTYDLTDNVLAELFAKKKPELVLVDGPSGGGNRRFGTLPLVMDYLTPSTTFFLDDALRGGLPKSCW